MFSIISELVVRAATSQIVKTIAKAAVEAAVATAASIVIAHVTEPRKEECR